MKNTHRQNTAHCSKELTVDLITEEEAAAVLGLKKSTLQQRRWLKQPPAYVKMGRFIRYRMADIVAYLDSCVVNPKAEG